MRLVLFIGFLFVATLHFVSCIFDWEHEQSKLVVQAVDAFAPKFFSTLATGDKNYVVSPVGAWLLLSIFYRGAKGNTERRLRAILGLPDDAYLEIVTTSEIELLVNNIQNAELLMGSKIYVQQGVEISRVFRSRIESINNAEIESINFGNSKQASNSINEWCRIKTHNFMEDIIQPSDLRPSTRLIALNALSFKSFWKTSFNPATPQKFYLSNEKDYKYVKYVPMMTVKSKFWYGKLPHASYVEIPLESEYDPISMFVILPNSVNEMVDLKKQYIDVKELLQQGSMKSVEITIPKFEITTELNLTQAFIKLGLEELFTSPNFTRIGEKLNYPIDKIAQKALIQVDEEGTSPAKVPGSFFTRLFEKKPIDFKANRASLIKIAIVKEHPVTLFDIEYTAAEHVTSLNEEDEPIIISGY